MSFGASQWLWGLLLLPVLPFLFLHAERRTARRLREFVAPRLLPQLTASVDRFRRGLRFALQVLALAFGLLALAQPRWGYTFEEAKRKGIDLLIAIDTSRSMLSNDVQPNRLQRVKLAAQDLIAELEGDRVGLIAFAGRAFLQAPLTIDYDAGVEAINDLDTKTIPEGGTNISDAIELATQTYGKSAVGNRALVIFTDGEELNGDALKTAKMAAGAGIRIFTIGVGTPQGSLIPISTDDGGTAFVKDEKGQVVKSKLDEKRLREIAGVTGGLYLHLDSGPATMHQLFTEGLAQLTAKEMDVRLSRRPIERYHWPLAAATVALSLSIWLGDRKRMRVRTAGRSRIQLAPAAAGLLLLFTGSAFSNVAGLSLYQAGKYADAYAVFQEDLKNHPDAPDRDKMEFDAGAAAYKMGDYDKAAEAFSQALLTKDRRLQENSHYNMGRTLEERAERAELSKTEEAALRDLENAQTHYEDVLKLNPNNGAAKANLEEVKKKIERLKKKRQHPTPPPQQQQQQQKNKNQQQQQDQHNQSQQNQQQQSSSQQNDQNQQNQKQDQQQSQQNTQSAGKQQSAQDRQNQNQQGQSQARNNRQPNQQPPNEEQSPSPSAQPQPGSSASPSPGQNQDTNQQKGGSGAENNPPQPSPSPSSGEPGASPSPSPGEGEGAAKGASPSASPGQSPTTKFAGEIKGAGQNSQPNAEQSPETAIEAEKPGEMSERQAQALLDSMKSEEARVQLDERRAVRRVYKDW